MGQVEPRETAEQQFRNDSKQTKGKIRQFASSNENNQVRACAEQSYFYQILELWNQIPQVQGPTVKK